MTCTLGLLSTSPVKSRSPLSVRKASSTAGFPSATVTLLELLRSATEVEMPPPNWTTNVSGACLIR